jgi:hypothetical protein
MAAQIAGIRLPKGARRPPIAPAYWISDEPSDDAVSVAGWLAEEFSRTGVWPLLWLYDKDPDAYMDQPGNPDHTDGISVQNVLHALGRSSIELLTASSFRRRCCHSRKLTTTLAFCPTASASSSGRPRFGRDRADAAILALGGLRDSLLEV